MTYARLTIEDDTSILPRMPSWVTSARTEAPEDVAFLSGAALSHLDLVLTREDVPQTLLRERLALRAAEACVALSGRPERAGELRDAAAFLQPGDQAGPAGEVYLSWRRAVEHPVSIKGLHRALPVASPDQIAAWLDAGKGSPVPRAAAVLQTVLEERPRDHMSALLFSDAALAQALGWDPLVPLLAGGLNPRDLRKTGEELRLACCRAVTTSAVEATGLAADLTRRATRLRAVRPKLRAKGAREAVTLFLTRDAVAPSALASLNSDRAARRFCDRLVELGAVRELTGRDTFRLYGM
ncbi:DUF1403 family protein [Ruegeria sp. HKCCD8929]|uniref:DUF1403 family protein n=1 Tax=Ruegeria sp. HKCCD8929 TaxID=2683006 RepID=UPI0014890E6D|nr:DUF1403 family protein [Ruegeria sp. HKCCD8929]